jgi:hypothetical protein
VAPQGVLGSRRGPRQRIEPPGRGFLLFDAPQATPDRALSSEIDQDRPDYTVYCGAWCIGRIYETRTGPAELRWFWALHAPSKPGSMRISNQVATLDIAKAEFEASWKQWKAWANLEEIDLRRGSSPS